MRTGPHRGAWRCDRPAVRIKAAALAYLKQYTLIMDGLRARPQAPAFQLRAGGHIALQINQPPEAEAVDKGQATRAHPAAAVASRAKAG